MLRPEQSKGQQKREPMPSSTYRRITFFLGSATASMPEKEVGSDRPAIPRKRP